MVSEHGWRPAARARDYRGLLWGSGPDLEQALAGWSATVIMKYGR